MKKPLIFFILVALLAPFAVAADDKYEVTIRVLEMDEETPETVINTISLPQISIDTTSVANNLNGETAELPGTPESSNFADDLGSNMDKPEIEVDIDEIKGEVNSHGKGK